VGRDIRARLNTVDSVLRTARAADLLTRSGAREPALVLLQGELGRAGIPVREAVDAEEASVEERVGRARRELASFLRRELAPDLERVRAGLRHFRRLFVGASLLGTGGLALVYAVASKGDVSRGARWTVSSHWGDTPGSGVMPEHGFFFSPPAYFFHTNPERMPWFSVDLGRERVVSGVEIRNRLGSCRARARALTVEISRDGSVFERVASHPPSEDEFAEWKTTFGAVRARYVRIVGTPNEYLHLSDVRVLGS
jgi:hypothetical protein